MNWGKTESVDMQHEKIQGKIPPVQPSTDEARSAVWSGILRVAKYLGKREPLPIKHPPVIQFTAGSAEIPVYFIGAGLPEFRMAQLMSSEHPVFGVEVPWPLAWRDAAANNNNAALPNMEQLVAPYVAALSSHSRSSSCVLAGHSFCGLMAFEAAHQLREQGVGVDMVILLDTVATNNTPHQVAWRTLQKSWNRAPTNRISQPIVSRLLGSWSVIQWMLVKEMRWLGRYFLQTVWQDPGVLTTRIDDLGVPLYWASVERVYANALRCYRLRGLDCRGVLFRASPEDERHARALDGTLGWGNLFGRGLEIIQVTGDHKTMWEQEPHVSTLAREMSKMLDHWAELKGNP